MSLGPAELVILLAVVAIPAVILSLLVVLVVRSNRKP